MENPAYWGPVERAIMEAMDEAEEADKLLMYGPSVYMRIANKLRGLGFIKEPAE